MERDHYGRIAGFTLRFHCSIFTGATHDAGAERDALAFWEPANTPTVSLFAKVSPETPDISIVVGVYNEEAVLPELHRRLTAALTALGKSYEIVLVDDGSQDRSLAIMRELQ